MAMNVLLRARRFVKNHTINYYLNITFTGVERKINKKDIKMKLSCANELFKEEKNYGKKIHCQNEKFSR
jgi:hypothetical protein